MPVAVCVACSKSLNVENDLAGQRLPCPRCGADVVVPDFTMDAPRNLVTQTADDEATRAVEVTAGSLEGDRSDFDTNSDDADLVGFLRPAQVSDEIGRLGAFRVLKILGHGGMGVVFLAEDTKLQRKVAVKAMRPHVLRDPQAGLRFLREARAMGQVEHPHVARIYQVDEDRGIPFLAMEFLRGESLDTRLRRENVLAMADLMRIGREIALGLSAAHALGLVHRDIKPANIWLESPNGSVKILDFGLARAESPEEHVTERGVIVGTPAFMAPEQTRGGDLDARTDLFSLGVVLYRLATGQMPFAGKDAIATMLSVASDKPTSPRVLNPAIPAEIERLILKLLAKSPGDRFATASETADALAAVGRSLGLDSTPPDRRPKPINRIAVGFAAVVCLALIVGGVVFGGRLFGTPAPAPIVGDPPIAAVPPEKVVPAKVAQSNRFPVEILESPDEVWSPPINLGPTINASLRQSGPTLSLDEKIMVFNRDGNLWIARRDDRDVPFSEAVRLPDSVNAVQPDVPSISGDGLLLVFAARKNGDRIWMCERASIDDPFGPPKQLPAPVNIAAFERAPILSPDGLDLFVTSIGRPGVPTDGEIVQFSRRSRNEPFETVTPLPRPVNTPGFDVADWISPDKRVFIATHMDKPSYWTRIFVRPEVDAAFGSAGPLVGPVPWSSHGRPWISPDARRIYFHFRGLPGSRSADLDIWMSRRIPKKS